MNTPQAHRPLGRARELGSAKAGVESWWLERATAIALVPLTLWLCASLIALTGSDYERFVTWLRAPFAAGSMVLLLIALFSHLALGLQVIIEDYIHSEAKIPAVWTVRFLCSALTVVGILATLRIAFAH